MQNTLTGPGSTPPFACGSARRSAGGYRSSLRQHYRPAVSRIPRWLLRVWLWF